MFYKKILLLFILSVFSFSSYGNGKCEPEFSKDQSNQLNQKIEDALTLNRNIKDALSKAGLTVLGDLTQKTEKTLLEIPNIGPISVQHIQNELAKKGFTLGMKLEDGRNSATEESAQTDAPAESAKPAESEQTAEPAKPAESEQTTESAKPAESEQTAQTDAPAKPTNTEEGNVIPDSPSIFRRTAEGLLSTAQTVGHQAGQIVGFSEAVDQAKASQSEAPENAGRTQRALRGVAFAGQVGLNVAGRAAEQAAQRIRKPKAQSVSVGDINLDTAIDKAYLPHAKKLPEHIATLRDLTQTTESELIESGLNAQQVHQIKLSLSSRGYHLAETTPSIFRRTAEGLLSTAQTVGHQAGQIVGFSEAVDQAKASQSEAPENAGRTQRALRGVAFAGQVGLNVAGQVAEQAAQRIRKPKDSDESETTSVGDINLDTAIDKAYLPHAKKLPEHIATLRDLTQTTESELIESGLNAQQVHQIKLSLSSRGYHLAETTPSIFRRTAEGLLSTAQTVGHQAGQIVGFSEAVDQAKASQSEAPENASRTQRALRGTAFAGQVGLNVAGRAAQRIRKPKDSDKTSTDTDTAQPAETPQTAKSTDSPQTAVDTNAQQQTPAQESGKRNQSEYVRSFWSQTLNSQPAEPVADVHTEESKPSVVQRTAEGLLSTAQIVGHQADQFVGFSQAVNQAKASQPEAPENAGRTQRALRGVAFAGQVGLNVAGRAAEQAAQRIRKPKDSDDQTAQTAEPEKTPEESRPGILRRTAEGILSTAQTVGHRADQAVGFSRAMDQARASQSEAPEDASRTQRALRGTAFAGQIGLNVAGQVAQRIRKPKNSDEQTAQTAEPSKPSEQTAQQTQAQNHYEVLGVSPSASTTEIQTAYRRAIQKYHPDRNPDNPSAHEHVLQINKAFQVLRQPSTRSHYDDSLNN